VVELQAARTIESRSFVYRLLPHRLSIPRYLQKPARDNVVGRKASAYLANSLARLARPMLAICPRKHSTRNLSTQAALLVAAGQHLRAALLALNRQMLRATCVGVMARSLHAYRASVLTWA